MKTYRKFTSELKEARVKMKTKYTAEDDFLEDLSSIVPFRELYGKYTKVTDLAKRLKISPATFRKIVNSLDWDDWEAGIDKQDDFYIDLGSGDRSLVGYFSKRWSL